MIHKFRELKRVSSVFIYQTPSKIVFDVFSCLLINVIIAYSSSSKSVFTYLQLERLTTTFTDDVTFANCIQDPYSILSSRLKVHASQSSQWSNWKRNQSTIMKPSLLQIGLENKRKPLHATPAPPPSSRL